MSVVSPALIPFESSFAHALEGLFVPWQAAPAPEPRLLAFNDELAAELGLDGAALRAPDGVAVLVGNAVVEGSTPIAQAYAGHQFGGYSPRLGDGRALLLGEVIDVAGRRRDIHLKGSGRTPFARGADGRAAVGPMLREYVIGEAMHALGIPTTRALAVAATGAMVTRETPLPGAVLARVAASHLRVGTFEYAAALGDAALLRRLADYAIARHHPAAAESESPYLDFYAAVVETQARLVAQWMLVGFIHGVMNTDNMTISGETIDYGPCAFMDRFDPATVFSSIDHHGRYAYGNQPPIAQWNLARLGETLLALVDPDVESAAVAATGILHSFPARFHAHWMAGMRAKLGLDGAREQDAALFDDLLELMHAHEADYTGCFRALAQLLRADDAPVRALFGDAPGFVEWAARWRARLPVDLEQTAAAMDAVNPVYIPRNHRVEEALAMATAGDMAAFEQLVDVVTQPFTERPGLAGYAGPAPAGDGPYRTFCGT